MADEKTHDAVVRNIEVFVNEILFKT